MDRDLRRERKYLGTCIVLDASALQGDVPGPQSICTELDVTAWMKILHIVHEKCWILTIPREALGEIEKRLKALLATPFISELLRLFYEKNKLYIEEVGGVEGDEAYLALIAKLTNRCSEIIFVTCDRELRERASTMFRNHTRIRIETPSRV